MIENVIHTVSKEPKSSQYGSLQTTHKKGEGDLGEQFKALFQSFSSESENAENVQVNQASPDESDEAEKKMDESSGAVRQISSDSEALKNVVIDKLINRNNAGQKTEKAQNTADPEKVTIIDESITEFELSLTNTGDGSNGMEEVDISVSEDQEVSGSTDPGSKSEHAETQVLTLDQAVMMADGEEAHSVSSAPNFNSESSSEIHEKLSDSALKKQKGSFVQTETESRPDAGDSKSVLNIELQNKTLSSNESAEPISVGNEKPDQENRDENSNSSQEPSASHLKRGETVHSKSESDEPRGVINVEEGSNVIPESGDGDEAVLQPKGESSEVIRPVESKEPVLSADEKKQGSPDEIKQASPDEMKQGSTNEIKQGSLDEIKQGSPDEMKQGSLDEIKQASPDEIKQGSPDEIKQGSTNEIKQGSLDEIKQGSTNEIKQGSLDEIKQGSPDENDLSTDLRSNEIHTQKSQVSEVVRENVQSIGKDSKSVHAFTPLNNSETGQNSDSAERIVDRVINETVEKPIRITQKPAESTVLIQDKVQPKKERNDVMFLNNNESKESSRLAFPGNGLNGLKQSDSFSSGQFSENFSSLSESEKNEILWKEHTAELTESDELNRSELSAAALSKLGDSTLSNHFLRRVMLPGLTQAVLTASGQADRAESWQRHNFVLEDGSKVQLSARKVDGVLQIKLGATIGELSKLLQIHQDEIREHLEKECNIKIDLQFDQGTGDEEQSSLDNFFGESTKKPVFDGGSEAGEQVEKNIKKQLHTIVTRNFGYNSKEWTA